jgi:hypothetical protein
MVPLVAMEAVAIGVLAGLGGRGPKRAALLCSVAVIVVSAYELHPFDAKAPMPVEAQWDVVNQAPRRLVTACLKSRYDGTSIMASMGSLGHYMQEASASGFAIRDFLHEGNGDIWLAALERPEPYADWLLIEEKAEGGDMLARLARAKPRFLAGYDRVCDGAGMALYRRAGGRAPADAADTDEGRGRKD